jgi:hypothetical protein
MNFNKKNAITNYLYCTGSRTHNVNDSDVKVRSHDDTKGRFHQQELKCKLPITQG